MSVTKKTFIFVLSFGILLAAGFTIFRLKNPSIIATDEDQVEITTPIPSKSTVPTLKIGNCTNAKLGISVNAPVKWECTVEDDSITATITLKHDLLTVTISNSGRSGPCEPPEDPRETPSCLASLIYQNDIVKLDQYKDNGATTEFFGTFKNFDDKYMIVSYDEMFQRDLTASEKSELVELLDSIALQKTN
jgi:hypothetical protein